MQQLKADKTLKNRTEWSPKQTVRLLEICLEMQFKCYKGKIYTQSDGTLIGKSNSRLWAGIFVAWFKKLFVKKGKFKAKNVNTQLINLAILTNITRN